MPEHPYDRNVSQYQYSITGTTVTYQESYNRLEVIWIAHKNANLSKRDEHDVLKT